MCREKIHREILRDKITFRENNSYTRVRGIKFYHKLSRGIRMLEHRDTGE